MWRPDPVFSDNLLSARITERHATMNHPSFISRMLIALLLLTALPSGFVLSGDDAPLQPEAVDPIELADSMLMQQIQRQVEAIPEAERLLKGRQILLDNVDKFQGDNARRRVYFSIGQLYKAEGDSANAMIYFEKGGASEDGSRMGAFSREHVPDLLEAEGDAESIQKKALEFRDSADGTDEDFASFTQRAGMALIQAGDRDRAVELGIDAAKRRPCRATFGVLETLSGSANNGPTDNKSYLKGMRWLASDRSGDFGQSARFLGNLAHAEEFSGNIDESIRIRQRIVEQYPKSENVVSHLYSISSMSFSQGDTETARSSLSKLAEGDFPDDVRARARNSLNGMLDQLGVQAPRIASPTVVPTPSRWRIVFVLANLLVLALIGVLVFLKKRASK